MFHETLFLNHIEFERRCSPATLEAYGPDLALFVKFCTEKQCLTTVAEVRHLHVRAWIVEMMGGGLSARSVNRKLSALKTYFKFLKKRGLVEKDPMLKVVAPKMGKRLPVVVQENQMELLFSKIEFPENFKGQRDKLVLEILYATGMRRAEIEKLEVSDVDFGRCTIKVHGKGNKQRIVPFARPLLLALENYMRLRRESFPFSEDKALLLNDKGTMLNAEAVYRIAHKYLSLVTSVEQRSPHVFRHSFATHLSNAGADLNAIKELLGHASLAATQIYTHNSIEKLKKVYEQAHPKSKTDD